MKGIKAKTQLTISGGTITIDAQDDGIHSDGGILISGGNILVKSGDDAIHADKNVEITGGDINIPYSREGIEGLTLTITGGDINLYAYDDGLNAAGNADGSPREERRPGGWGGGGMFVANDDNAVRITGGNITVYALYDGIDSNGHISLEGGTLKISGPSAGMDGAIDLDGNFIITGGELITAGSVQSVNRDSTQPIILVSYRQQQASGSVITMKDAQGKTLLEYESQTSYSLSGFTSEAFKIGETYTLFINGEKRTDITLTGLATTISDDGSAYNAGSGGGPGGGRNPGGGRTPSADGRTPDGEGVPGGGNPGGGRIQ
jgi:hypothetical protein